MSGNTGGTIEYFPNGHSTHSSATAKASLRTRIEPAGQPTSRKPEPSVTHCEPSDATSPVSLHSAAPIGHGCKTQRQRGLEEGSGVQEGRGTEASQKGCKRTEGKGGTHQALGRLDPDLRVVARVAEARSPTLLSNLAARRGFSRTLEARNQLSGPGLGPVGVERARLALVGALVSLVEARLARGADRADNLGTLRPGLAWLAALVRSAEFLAR
eukprot:607772-Rhodomonas_salina.2